MTTSHNQDMHAFKARLAVFASLPIILVIFNTLHIYSDTWTSLIVNKKTSVDHSAETIIDLTVPMNSFMPLFNKESSLGPKWIRELTRVGELKDDRSLSTSTTSELTLHTHCGTHIDAFKHFAPNNSKYNNRTESPTNVEQQSPSTLKASNADHGDDIESLDLNALIGPAIVVDIDEALHNDEHPIKVIDKHVMEKLNVTHGVQRLLLKTSNSRNALMFQPRFVKEYVGLTESAARFLVDETEIKLVGKTVQ